MQLGIGLAATEVSDFSTNDFTATKGGVLITTSYKMNPISETEIAEKIIH